MKMRIAYALEEFPINDLVNIAQYYFVEFKEKLERVIKKIRANFDWNFKVLVGSKNEFEFFIRIESDDKDIIEFVKQSIVENWKD